MARKKKDLSNTLTESTPLETHDGPTPTPIASSDATVPVNPLEALDMSAPIVPVEPPDPELQVGGPDTSLSDELHAYPSAKAARVLWQIVQGQPVTHTNARLDAAETLLKASSRVPPALGQYLSAWLAEITENARIELPHRVRAARLLMSMC